ncbi:phage integrase family protein [Cupriavidus pampae]|uniref:Tyrosine recombinase XerC n=1 Tax=Cupriavidus pampae TaxID=659251 RepID=A0ABM8XSV2_9BURK|nr:phage integrase family protein [Cupriavidus pampae]CAG9183404.1 Tyrosine recombinase XerC [Cupriavidus pampae]
MPPDTFLELAAGHAAAGGPCVSVAPGRAITRRRLHRGHFAFLRAVVEGLAPQAVWERYLPEAGDYADTPRVHRVTGWIRTELAAAAARGGDFAQARLLRLDLAPRVVVPLPTLAAFADTQGLTDCGEAEQLAAYEAAFGMALACQRRRTALLHRQLAAIHTLEARIAMPPRPADGVEAWLIASLAARLIAADVPTLGALHARMALSRAWWRQLRGIGIIKARALGQFVATHADTLGALPDSAQTDLSGERCSALMPLEHLVVPVELSGAAGRFRAPHERCLLAADDDRAAILAWLAARGRAARAAAPATLTQRAYRKEAERMLLWAVLWRRRALSSLTVEDCVAYRDFLLAPDPTWCGGIGQPRWSSRWRPFAGPLSPRSCAYAIGVLGNLFGFLVDQGYLLGNPWRAVVAPCEVARGPDAGRGFTTQQWRGLRQALAQLPPGLASLRLQLALPLLHDTGLRLAELMAATTADLRRTSLPQADGAPLEGWWLMVRGKGGKVREVPVPAVLVDCLVAYLAARGCAGVLQAGEAVPLLGPAHLRPAPSPGETALVSGRTGVSGNAFHRQLKRFLARCAERLEGDDPAAARRMRAASAHWLRHTHVSHALAAGVPIEVVQQNVGHASLDTTTRYVHTECARRLQAMQRLWQIDSA